jgi:hypothetical protein
MVRAVQLVDHLRTLADHPGRALPEEARPPGQVQGGQGQVLRQGAGYPRCSPGALQGREGQGGRGPPHRGD